MLGKGPTPSFLIKLQTGKTALRINVENFVVAFQLYFDKQRLSKI